MKRGFGIDATVSADVAGSLAERVESLGYGSFWVNGSPAAGAFDILQAAADASDLDLGVGVLPLTSIGVREIIEEVRARDLPQDRLWLGVGSNRKPGALAEVREACEALRDELDCRVVSGAVGPRMTQLAAEAADCVLFTWWPRNEVANSRQLIDEAAADAGREVPVIASYVRCALLPQAQDSLEEKAERYAQIPRYAEVFARNNITAAESVVTGRDRDGLLERIEHEEVVMDLPIIRAITADDGFESLSELAEATRP
jgi:alkanesulfonate monooxygenase SsuD/methylene tetrahydromethanopterin reductase-like flavin-dependent oxidoreductase (luciferase family)